MERSRPDVLTRIVIFDLGEVLATTPKLFSELSARIEASPQEVETAYWLYRDEHDRGDSAEVFWTSVLRELGSTASSALVAQLSDLDSEAWTRIRPGAFDLLSDLAEGGTRIGILSNAPSELAAFARRSDWSSFVSDWFFSGELRMTKPDPALYGHVSSTLNLPAEAIAFVDDRQVNVDAALAAGWNAHLWASDADTRAFLEHLGQL